MEKNIENNTENKFGNFLNFMKKFLAMSFFCAIAAFGFGALNVRAEISSTEQKNYIDVDDISTTSGVVPKISGIPSADDAHLKDYTIGEDGVLYHYKDSSSGGATAYALKRGTPTKDAEGNDVPNIAKPADGKLEISANYNIVFDAGTFKEATVNKIHTQLIDDGVTDLTIKGYDLKAGTTDTGNVTLDGTGTNKLKSLTVKTSDGKGVGANKLAVAQTAFKDVVKDGEDNITTPHNYKISKNSVTIDESKAGKDDKILTELDNKIKVTDSDDKEIKGNWAKLKSITGTSKYNATFTPDTTSNLEPEIFEITITTGTPAKAEKTEVEYEAGKTTWGEILKNAKVNTSAENGAKGSWKVTTDKVEGTIIDYGSGLEYLGKMEPGLTKATLTYISGEGDSFADSDSDSITIFLKDRTEDLKEFGNYEFKTFGDYTFFVNKDTGSTCTMLSSEKGQISWLREESYGTAAWYGFDNSEGALPEGSIVSVKWYGKDDEGYSEKLEKAAKGIQSLGIVAEKDKIWVFELNAYKKVKDDNGTVKYEKVSDFDGKKLKMYIELGNDWDMNDVSYLYIDENSKVTSWSKFLDIEIKEINGEMKTFAILNLKHFSTHMIYDEKKVNDIVDNLRKAAEDAKANYIKNLPEGKIATEDELNQIAADALTKAYDALDKDDKEQLDKYLEQMGLTATPEADKTDNSKTENGSTTSNSKANSSTSGNSSTSDNSSTSGNSSTSNKSSRSTSSTAKTGKNETLSALLFLLCGGGTLSLNLAMRKKYFNA